jgi:hypothetical protein
MLSLLQFFLLDDVHAIYFDMIIARPSLVFYFGPLIFIVGLALMNLFTAVVVEGAFAQAKLDNDVAQAYKKQLAKSNLPRLQELFISLDQDCSGDITLDELHDASAEALEDLSKLINLEDVDELYAILDEDNDGRLTWAEFYEGICRIISSNQSIESIGTVKRFERQKHAIAELTRKVEAIPVLFGRSRAGSDHTPHGDLKKLDAALGAKQIAQTSSSSLYVPL